MKNITQAIELIKAEVLLLQKKIGDYELTIANLDALSTDSVGETTGNDILPVVYSQESKLTPLLNMEEYKDYPYGKRTADKLKYFDEKFPRGFRMKNRLSIMELLEPKEMERIRKNISQDLKYLVNTGIYMALKYNGDNKTQFYFRTEWLNIDGQNTTVKQGFELSNEDLGSIPEFKRKNIKWIYPGEA